MTITLELSPEVEQGLLAQARAMGIPVAEYARQIVERHAREAVTVEGRPKSLVQFFRESPLVGLDLKLERDQDPGRDITL
jgi:uncharacterized Fe-S cluster-containing protein